MRLACAEALTEIVADEAVESARQRSVDRLWPQTEKAMTLAESLLAQWDDGALDAMAAMNLDLDVAREERRALWEGLGARGVLRDGASVTSRSPSHARWTVMTDAGPRELEVQMTAEREPRIQTLSVRVGPEPGGIPQ